MNRLWVRLALAFVLVTLVAVGAVALLADWSATQAFTNYIARQNEFVQSGRLDDLAAFYQRTGSWSGVAAFFAGEASGGRNRPVLLLADAAATVVFDERGQRPGSALTFDERSRALPISVNDQVVGYVVFNAAEGGALTPAQQNFVTQLRLSFVVAALAAGALGIVLGVAMSRSLAAPLAKTAETARAFAAREWQQRAPVSGADEIAQVGRAFNAMADSLQQAESLRRNLMADIAHELRTPLTVMQGNLRALLDGVYPLEAAEIATLYDETRLLSRLVDDLRELALADAGRLSLHLQPVEVARLLRQAGAHFSGAASAQNITLSLNAPETLPAVRADADRLAQVLRNLVANALRHTPEGGQVTLAAECRNGQVRISVQDTGEGIAAEAVPHVFERFYRADKSRSRSSGGTGLGLAIAKAWVEVMGGAIGVESAPGQGSCFWFSLPRAV